MAGVAMKKWFIFAAFVVIVLVGGYLFLSYQAVKFVEGRLQKVIGPGLTIAEIKMKPTCLVARGIRYEDPLSKGQFLQIEEVRIYPALLSFLKESLQIREVAMIQPSFFFARSREGALSGPWMPVEKEKVREVSEKRKEKEEPTQIKIDRFRIQKGSVDFEDRKMGEPPAQIRLRDLSFDIGDIRYPLVSHQSPLELEGKMEGQKEGSLSSKGWIDIRTSDMEMSFKAQGIDVKIFEPYYRKRVSASLESGYMDMETKVTVKERMIHAPGQMGLSDLRIKEGEGTIFYIPAKTLVSLLKKKGNRIEAKFLVKGNLDDPQFDLQETLLTRVGISVAEALGVPIKIVGESLFKGTGKGASGITEGFRAIGELFKKKKK
jgi:hypothetical protein